MILHYCIAVFCSIVSSLCIWINFHESFIYNSGHTLLHILDLLTILFMGKLKASCIKITYCDSILELNFHYLLIFWKSTVLCQYQPLNYVSGVCPGLNVCFCKKIFLQFNARDFSDINYEWVLVFSLSFILSIFKMNSLLNASIKQSHIICLLTL